MAPPGRTVFVALGSNQGASVRILREAVRKLAARVGVLEDCSHLYSSRAQLLLQQPDFLNAVVQLRSALAPATLLAALQAVEAEYCNAKAAVRYGPRELDLDIVGFLDGEQVAAPDGSLTVPHERAHARDFVLRPLCDMPSGRSLRLGNGLTAAEALAAADNRAGFDAGSDAGFGASLSGRTGKVSDEDKATRVVRSVWTKRGEGEVGRNEAAPMVMGVLNVTPDSFSDGGRFVGVEEAVRHAKLLAEQGAHVVDVGGVSTRPNAAPVSAQEEMDRILPVIERLAADEAFSRTCAISVDTRAAATARAAVRAGADLVNDELGELDDEPRDDADVSMLAVAAELGVPLITMHTRGTARTMEDLKLPADVDVVAHVGAWLAARAAAALTAHAIPRWDVMVDPGLGFAKTNEQSVDILARLDQLVPSHLPSPSPSSSFGASLGASSPPSPGEASWEASWESPWGFGASSLAGGGGGFSYPVLVGASRKRFVREHTAFDVDVATAAATTAAVLNGASMVRVHSVPHAVDAIALAWSLAKKRERR